MIKKLFFISISVALSLNATTITDIFQSLKKQPISKRDTLDVVMAKLDKKSAEDALYPKLNGSLSYEHFNRPSSMRPFLPTETSTLLANDEPLPFSKDIYKAGVNFSFPLFVKALYTIKDKAKILKIAKDEKRVLNLIQREATILGANANMRYLENLLKALDKKRDSLLKTKEDIAIKVKNGRAAGISLVKIDESLNAIDISKNKILSNISELRSVIYTLSGVDLQKSVDMQKTKEINKEKLFALLPLKASLKARKMALKASKESLYPSLFLKAGYAKSYAKGYNNDKSLDTGFGSIGLYLNIPIFDRSKYTKIQKARVAYESEALNISYTKHSLLSDSAKLQRDLSILKRSEKLAKKSIELNKELLKVAKISYENERMSEEEYLRYENALFDSYASLYDIEAKKWQDIAKLAVIYGNDLEEIVK